MKCKWSSTSRKGIAQGKIKAALKPACTTWLIIFNLLGSLALLKKSEMCNVNTNVIVYIIFGFIAIKNIKNIKNL